MMKMGEWGGKNSCRMVGRDEEVCAVVYQGGLQCW